MDYNKVYKTRQDLYTKKYRRKLTRGERKLLLKVNKQINKYEDILYEDDINYLNNISKEEYMFACKSCGIIVCVETVNSFKCLNKTIKINPCRFYAYKRKESDNIIFIKAFKMDLEFFVFDKREIRDKIQKELEKHYRTNKEDFNYV